MRLTPTKYPPPAPRPPDAPPGPPAPDARMAFYDRLLPRLQGIAGVEAAALTTNVPPFGGGWRTLEIEGRPPVDKPEENGPRANVVSVSPGFFKAVGVQLQRGRDFADVDGTPGNETVVVSQKFAAKYFPNEEAIGRRIRYAPQTPRPGQPVPPTPVWRTIVGISPIIRHANPQDNDPPGVMYVPMRQNPPSNISLMVLITLLIM